MKFKTKIITRQIEKVSLTVGSMVNIISKNEYLHIFQLKCHNVFSHHGGKSL